MNQPPQADSIAGRHIGPYQVVRELGHGGMGAVYLAVRADDQFKQQVAIKLIKRGMDTDFIVSRFRHERQILASFHHPNIAGLLDGGSTDDGLPYFVMEYIEGHPIHTYCETHRLAITERIKLFRQVCAAVHYAHQNLVIHRDLKPSNMLVTADGTPKLLDFGIAKILSPTLAATTIQDTATFLRLMTPEYASPEQARGEPITTASDVYTLGVVLYELLTGHRPYQFKNRLPDEIARTIGETQPVYPSAVVSRAETATMQEGEIPDATTQVASKVHDRRFETRRRQLAGDLDNIVLMAMRKEPQRRYSSVEQFSEDLRRHLEGLPVIARKDTLWYRATKFVGRHKTGVAAALLIVLSLVGGIVESTRQARLAERRFNDVRQLANSFLFEFHDAIETLPGSTPVRELVVKRALEYLDKLAQEASGDPSLLQELATAYQRVGDVQGRPGFANLGDKAGALASYRKALQIREPLVRGGAGEDRLRLELATNYDRLGDSLRLTGDVAQALEHYRQSLRIREALSAASASDGVIQRDLANSYSRLGDSLAATGNLAAAVDAHRRALKINEKLASDPSNTKDRRALFISHIKTGDMLARAGDANGALESYRHGLAISKALSDAAPMNAQASRELAAGYDKVGNILLVIGDKDLALQHYGQAQSVRQRLVEVDPKNAELLRDLSISFDKIGNVMEEKNDLAAALANYRQALQINRDLAAKDETNSQLQLDVSISHRQIGDVLAKSNDLTGALRSHSQALDIRQRSAAADPKNTEVQEDLAESYDRMGEVQQKAADAGGALESYLEALKIRQTLAADLTNSEARASLASTFANLGRLYSSMASTESPGQQAAHWHEARSYFQQSLDVLVDLRARGALTPGQSGELDQITAELAKCDDALAQLPNQ
ncbi:MAG TPA: serine/threonine-protein kinase [Vicinamibacterales bacterium]|jgi:serine/threonine protein kinase/tetratricopeptide (TPR) repeat protein